MDWAASVTSLIMIWLMGSKSKYGPIVGLVSQVVWFIYTITAKQWGLLPGVVGFTIVHLRNTYLWWKPERRT